MLLLLLALSAPLPLATVQLTTGASAGHSGFVCRLDARLFKNADGRAWCLSAVDTKNRALLPFGGRRECQHKITTRSGAVVVPFISRALIGTCRSTVGVGALASSASGTSPPRGWDNYCALPRSTTPHPLHIKALHDKDALL